MKKNDTKTNKAALEILCSTGIPILEAALVDKAATEAGCARLRQKGGRSVHTEVRTSEATARRALKRCKKIIALGVEALKQQ